VRHCCLIIAQFQPQQQAQRVHLQYVFAAASILGMQMHTRHAAAVLQDL
jgi:hypothetical protein